MTAEENPPSAAKTVACTVSRDVQVFDLLVEDMEVVLGAQWGDLGFAEILGFFGQPGARHLEFIALAIDAEDEAHLPVLEDIITQARAHEVKVILIAEDVTPSALHRLLRSGADEFIPYPLPENELKEVIDRLRAEAAAPAQEKREKSDAPAAKEGVVLAVHGLAGGTGATTLAVNLAWELASIKTGRRKTDMPSVCIIDLDLQFGAVATQLDLPRREVIFDLLSDTENMDDEAFAASLLTFDEKLQVFTAPADVLPLDLIDAQDLERLLSAARRQFDYVLIDMPSTLVGWTETVLNTAHLYFCMIELDMRSAQNTLRFRRALQAEDLPVEKLRFALNRAPRFTDLSGKARCKRMAETLGISIDLHLPDGGAPVQQAADHGMPLAQAAHRNALRRDIAKLAQSLHALNDAGATAA